MLELALALHRIGSPRVLVCGDEISDCDIHCDPKGFSQEAAHCPVWKLDQSDGTSGYHFRVGGAGAVAAMAEALGASVHLISAPCMSTKTRYLIHGQQVLRIDNDAPRLSTEQTERIAGHVADEVQRADWVLIGDYGKGVCTDAVLRAAIDGAKARGIPCIVDPAHGADWKRYVGATCIKCNHAEWQSHENYADKNGLNPHGHWRNISDRFIVTKGAGGMVMIQTLPYEEISSIECRPRNAVDVTGAGDMVLAALGICIAGMTWPDACRVANAAAGLKVERRGAVPVPKCEVVADLLDSKIIPDELLSPVAEAARLRGAVVWSNGCHDGHGLHRGHLYSLSEAKKQGDVLIVGVNGDRSVKSLKGMGRPISPIADRLQAVAALGCVDYVVEVQDDEHLAKCLQRVAPDVLVKGDDWRGKDIVGAEHAGRVHFVERLVGYSTTRFSE